MGNPMMRDVMLAAPAAVEMAQDMAAPAETLGARGRRAAAAAAAEAEAVDREARFPRAAVEALRAERLLGILLPAELGGEAARVTDAAEICYQLGQACASAAMIYAMHQSCIACVMNHRGDSAWHADLLRRIAADQLLLASSTTEGSAGGNVRASAAPIMRQGDRIELDRAASVVSYGDEADVIVTTARRSATAAATDQVLVSFLRADYELQPTGSWDPLGMRGTCSRGFALRARGLAAQVLPAPYEQIHGQSMVPVSHLLWSASWTGIAAAAAERARAFSRQAARGAGGTLPPGAAHLTKAVAGLQTLRGRLEAALAAYEARRGDARALTAVDFQSAITLLKVEVSETAVGVVLAAARACGLAGYRNDSAFSIGRALRDILSAPIMINNDRILADFAKTSLLVPVPATIAG
jgi:acyl-CoA dehydrogenase